MHDAQETDPVVRVIDGLIAARRRLLLVVLIGSLAAVVYVASRGSIDWAWLALMGLFALIIGAAILVFDVMWFRIFRPLLTPRPRKKS